MQTYNYVMKSGSGKNTTLDKAYAKLISTVRQSPESTQERWEIYNLIIQELITIQDGVYFKELQYRMTDGENPNDVLMDLFVRVGHSQLSGMVWQLRRRIEEFQEEDFVNNFW